MKLPIKKRYFDQIKNGTKTIEYRDAHLTLICEETGETMRVDIAHVRLIPRMHLPEEIRGSSMFEDDMILQIQLKPVGEATA